MTGPEHYRTGQEQLAHAERAVAEATVNTHQSAYETAWLFTTMAQAHFTAALVAATAESIVQEALGTENEEIATAWSEAIS